MQGLIELKTIFVQIASYRDPELPRTIEDCLAKAKYPEHLRFGICWQFDHATRNDLEPWAKDLRFRIDRVYAVDSEGCCWARNRTNRLYEDEHFTLQIDAHMRFAQNWDERFLRMFERTNEDLAILSTYPPSYTRVDGAVTLAQLDHVPVLRLERLGPDLTTRQSTYPVEAPDGPVPIDYLAAGLLFAPGRFCRDVEYDPEGYFGGEEINLAVRAFSHGYRFFSPDENLVWHLYDHSSPKHWSDNPTTQTGRHKRALKRLETLLLGDHKSLGNYGLGTIRSVAQFEQQAKISFSDAKADIRKEEKVHFNRTVQLSVDEIPDRADYDIWVFCLLDNHERELYRNDINDPAVLLKRKSSVAVDATLDGQPTHYLLWPHTAEGFGDRLVYPILENSVAPKAANRVDESSTIFVAIASYCEPELSQTLHDCMDKARYPERLRFGVCLQYDEQGPAEIGRDCIDEFNNDVRFRVLKYDFRLSKGGSWARNLVQSLYRNERYTLQVDAHTRFIEDWDVVLIDMLEKMPSGNPLITGFPPLYFIDKQGNETFTDLDHPERVPTTVVERWVDEGWIHHPTRLIARNTRVPRRTRVISGALVFARGGWNTEVTQDPSAYFTGEEFALTLRSYTSGYDLFNPTRIVVWHRGHPQPNRKHFTDVSRDIADGHNSLAYSRLRILLTGDPERILGCFSLGSERTLEEYYEFSGLNCKDYSIHPDARNGVPPDPLTVMPGDASQPAALGEITLYVRDAEPLTLPCHRAEPDVGEVLSILSRRAASGHTSKRVRRFRFADRELWLRECDLVSIKIDMPE